MVLQRIGEGGVERSGEIKGSTSSGYEEQRDDQYKNEALPCVQSITI